MKKGLSAIFTFIILFTLLGNVASVSALPGNASLDEEEQRVKSILLKYYEICQKEDLEGYLSLMNVENESQREFLKHVAEVTWQKIDTLSYDIENLRIILDKERKKAWAFYHVRGEIEYAVDGEKKKLNTEHDYVAFLSKVKGNWKIDKIVPKAIFYQNITTASLMGMLSEEATEMLSKPYSKAKEFILWKDMWHDAEGNGFAYRIPIDISSEIEVFGYQVCILLSSDNFNYSHAQADGGDVRLVMEREGNFYELPYWLETWNPKGESRIWVRLPHISGVSRIYLYYGNPEVEDKSNGKATFEFFEDFETYPVGETINGKDGWTVVEGTWTVEEGPTGGKCLFADTGGNIWWSDWSYGVFHEFPLHDNIAVDLDFYIDGNYDMYSNDPLMWFIFRNSDSDWVGIGWGGWYNYYATTDSGIAGGEGSISTIPTSQWLHLAFKALGSEVTVEKMEGGTLSLTTKSTSGDRIGFSLRAWKAYWDNIRIRKYIEPEPGYILGAEESAPKKVKAPKVEEAPVVSLTPASQKVHPGKDFSVTISVDPKGRGISGGELNLSFDAAVMQIAKVTAGDLLGDSPIIGIEEIDNEAGRLKYALARKGVTPVPTPKGSFASITFTVKEDAKPGEYDLVITKMGLSDENFEDITEVKTEGGKVVIMPVLPGDVNGDGKVDYKDLAILGAAYGKSKGEAGYNAKADLNGDGKIDYKDLAILGANYGKETK